ncbi:META domain-containing protein [uncultured Meiothermus sp.]|jgi:heat shock protein HslJ|uniref:META domain-containing protein n=1 Tax=uncultured Meiothermus sp. TaxID=157471 RepID=UPI002616CB31|nr:META domain-containing protein [uncultured Meiothermus sp.]
MRFIVLFVLLIKIAQIALAQSPSLDGTRWVLSSYALGSRFAQVSPAQGATLEFTQGRAGGFNGCNSFGGTYTQEGSKLSLGALVQTIKACPNPLDRLERDYHRSLAQVRSFALTSGVLRLKNQAGKTILIFAQARPQGLQGREWRVTALNTGSAVVSVAAGPQPTASFVGGRLSGNSGCNQFSATYTLNNFSLQVGPVTSTRRACLDEQTHQQEIAFLQALENVVSFRIVGNQLTLYDQEGSILVKLNR